MRRFLNSFIYAFNGIVVTCKSERNFRFHVAATIIAIAIGIYTNLSLAAWGFVIFSIGFVLVAELFNTAIERLCDETARGKQTQLIKNSKDISAAAVLIAALTALVIGILFLIVPFFQKIFELLQNR